MSAAQKRWLFHAAALALYASLYFLIDAVEELRPRKGFLDFKLAGLLFLAFWLVYALVTTVLLGVRKTARPWLVHGVGLLPMALIASTHFQLWLSLTRWHAWSARVSAPIADGKPLLTVDRWILEDVAGSPRLTAEYTSHTDEEIKVFPSLLGVTGRWEPDQPQVVVKRGKGRFTAPVPRDIGWCGAPFQFCLQVLFVPPADVDPEHAGAILSDSDCSNAPAEPVKPPAGHQCPPAKAE